jgi:hypothetical protein
MRVSECAHMRTYTHTHTHTHTQIHVWSWQYRKSCIYKIQWQVNLTLHFTVLQKQLAEEWYCLIQYNIFQDYGGSPTLFGVASVINHISEIFAYFFSFRLIKQIGHVKVILYSSTLYCCRNFYILCMAGQNHCFSSHEYLGINKTLHVNLYRENSHKTLFVRRLKR